MTTAMRLNEWLDANILAINAAPVSAFKQDTDPPVSKPQRKPPQEKKVTRTVRREERDLAARRARLERERRKEWKTLYPSDS
jgi:hypothetical protein